MAGPRCLLADGTLVLVTERDSAKLWPADGQGAGAPLAEFGPHEPRSGISDIVFLGDGKRVLTMDKEQARVWPVEGGAPLATFAAPTPRNYSRTPWRLRPTAKQQR